MSGIIEQPSTAAMAVEPTDASPRRGRAVGLYVLLALLSLVPGLLASLHLGLDEVTPPGVWLAAIDGEMRHIAFGRTPRFWMGVAGATMLALLLLYPLRKLLGIGSAISVAAWFHLHTIVGLLGPVLVLYHAYFGTGSTPANVALFTTLAVALSGIFGFLVHARLSSSFHDEKKRAHGHLQDAIAALQQLSATPSRAKFFDALEVYQREAGAESRKRWGTSPAGDRAALTEHATWLIETQGQQDGWSIEKRRETRSRLVLSLEAHFAGVRRASRRAQVERIARPWRLLHLPLFYVTIVAASIHVYKVWNVDVDHSVEGERGAGIDGGAEAEARVSAETAAASSAGGRSHSERAPRPAPFATRKVTTAEMLITAGPVAVATKGQSTGGPDPLPAATSSKSARASPASALPTATAKAPSALVEAPTAVQRSPGSAPLGETPMALGGGVGPGAPQPDPVGELAKRMTQWDNTGRLDPETIKERLAHYKKDAGFSHDQTRFPLTGKHKTLSCESCHKATLKDTARRCVDCHKQDDVHRGRRPNCESCHVPSDWGTIKRRG